MPTIHISKAPEKKWTKPAPWWTDGLKFPCGLVNHDHEVSMCAEFFFMTPGEKGDYIPRSKVCRTCLGPRDLCVTTGKLCSRSVPSKLICHGCEKFSKLQIMYCFAA